MISDNKAIDVVRFDREDLTEKYLLDKPMEMEEIHGPMICGYYAAIGDDGRYIRIVRYERAYHICYVNPANPAHTHTLLSPEAFEALVIVGYCTVINKLPIEEGEDV